MGNNICVGLVYDEFSSIQNELQNIIDYLIKVKTIIVNSKVALDEDGNEWIEKYSSNINCELLAKYYYGEINGSISNFNGAEQMPIKISIQKEKDFFGYIFYFDDIQLRKLFSIDEIEKIILDFIYELKSLSFTQFKYAFCDHDADVEYHPKRKKKIDKSYSLVYWPKKDQNLIIRNSWKIDGITQR